MKMILKPIVPFEPVSSDTIPEGPNWLAQVKWDGVRILTYYDGQEVRLFNRKLNERTGNYPELLDIKTYCEASSLILDGEIIALGPDGKPSFPEVMKRDGIRRMEKVAQAMKGVPITYMIFDILYVNGEWINRESLATRIAKMQEIVKSNSQVQLVTSHDEGEALFKAMEQHGMEGIVMKKKDSPYLIGEKMDHWCKVKNYRDIIAVVGGVTLKNDVVNALLLGLYDGEGRLWYIGHVGTGRLSHQDWRDITAKVKPLVTQDKPFVNKVEREREAVWVNPLLTVKVQFAEWTPARSLRQPSIQAFVEVPIRDCRFEMQAHC